MKVRTTSSYQSWQSRDGMRTIWTIALHAENGKDYSLRTYSPAIASVGFEGEVESYLNGRGDRFVRQKVGSKAAAKAAGPREDVIKAEWAIGQAINLASATMDRDQITLPIIERYARDLFGTVGKVQEA